MIDKLKNMNGNRMITLVGVIFSLCLLSAIFMKSCGNKSTTANKYCDTLYVNHVVHDTLYVEKNGDDEVVASKPIPAITKFKATDWVCAWGKWSGVVVGIRWSVRNPGVLVYEVRHLDVEGGWVEDEYYDTELTLGKCP